MIPTFEDALGELLAKYCDKPIDDLIAVMERALEGMYDQAKFEATDPGRPVPHHGSGP